MRPANKVGIGSELREREGTIWTVTGKSQEYWNVSASGGRLLLLKPYELEHNIRHWELLEAGSWISLQEPEQTFAARSWGQH